MGYDLLLFLTAPDASLVCSICQDVLENPRSLRCGHSFCAECLRDQAAAHTARREQSRGGTNRLGVHPPCPTCRGRGGDSFPNFVVKEMINGLKISCMNNSGGGSGGSGVDNNGQRSGAAGDNSEEGRRVRRRPNEDEDTNTNTKCHWTGRVDEWKHHADHDCCLQLISCDVSGCGAKCRRDEMADHQRSAACVEARIASRVSAAVAVMDKKYQQLEKKHKDLEKKYHELGGNSSFVIKFCRDWMIRKPDPLFDFVVYREAMQLDSAYSHLKKDVTKLLVGIPGPKRTVWEGGLYPVTFHWARSGPRKPPLCKLPAEFNHPNIFPSGIISLHSLNEEAGWRPDFTIPELMFDIQQLLAHPNVNSPAQSKAYRCYMEDKNTYDQIAAELAQRHTPERFHQIAADSTQWVPVEDSLQEPKVAPTEPSLSESNKDPVHKRPCSCSCCAWGTATGPWDRRLQMRFLWGELVFRFN